MGGMPFSKKKWRRSDLGVRTDVMGEGIREEERGKLRLGCKINNKFKIKKESQVDHVIHHDVDVF